MLYETWSSMTKHMCLKKTSKPSKRSPRLLACWKQQSQWNKDLRICRWHIKNEFMSCIINFYTLHNDTLCIEASSHGEYEENKTSMQTCDTPSHQIVVQQEENKLAKSFGKLLRTMCKLCWWQGKAFHHEQVSSMVKMWPFGKIDNF